jgi:hypothetical protein
MEFMEARTAQASAYLLRGGSFAGASAAAGMPSEASCFDMARRKRIIKKAERLNYNLYVCSMALSALTL